MKFINFINEALDSDNWLNLTNDTTNKSERPDSAFRETSEHIQRLLDEPDQSNVIFISPQLGLGADFLIFDKQIVPNSVKIKNDVVVDGTVTNYLHLYKYQNIEYILAEFRDIYEYGYIFITKQNFDEINALVYPDTAGEILPAAGDDAGMDVNPGMQTDSPQGDEFGLGEPDDGLQNDEFGSASVEGGSQDFEDVPQGDEFPETQDEEENQKSKSLLD